ncbi:MAG: MarR family winged helix-turn-helix transcriptional regulator [Thermomicrobiales bacterium]
MGSEGLIERLSRASERISMQMRSAADQDWPDIELTMPQLRTLVLLYRGPQRMGKIAATLGISLPATTNMIVRLDAKGLVERIHDRDDRRVVLCHLTPEGRGQAEALWNVQRQRFAAIADILTTEGMTKVVEAVELLAEAVERNIGSASCPVPTEPLRSICDAIADPLDTGIGTT